MCLDFDAGHIGQHTFSADLAKRNFCMLYRLLYGTDCFRSIQSLKFVFVVENVPGRSRQTSRPSRAFAHSAVFLSQRRFVILQRRGLSKTIQSVRDFSEDFRFLTQCGRGLPTLRVRYFPQISFIFVCVWLRIFTIMVKVPSAKYGMRQKDQGLVNRYCAFLDLHHTLLALIIKTGSALAKILTYLRQ